MSVRQLPKGALGSLMDVVHYGVCLCIVLLAVGVPLRQAAGAALILGYLVARLLLSLEDILLELRERR